MIWDFLADGRQQPWLGTMTFMPPKRWLQLGTRCFLLSYEAMGYVAATAISCKYAVVEKPDGYSLSDIEQLGIDYGIPLASETDTPITLVNLICIMNESLADLHVAGDFETN